MLREIVGFAANRFINSGICKNWKEGRKTDLLLASQQVISQIPLWADLKGSNLKIQECCQCTRESCLEVSLMINQTFSGVVQLADYLRTGIVFWSHIKNVGHGKIFAYRYWHCSQDGRSCHQIRWCCINRPLMY